MRVLLTTDTIGGVWTFTAELAHGLLSARHAVVLVSFGRLPSPAQASTMQALAEDFGDRFRYIPSAAPLEWMDRNDRACDDGGYLLEQIVGDFAPAVLHSHQFCFGRLSSLLPVLVTAHSDVLTWAESTLGSVVELGRTASPEWLRTYRELVGNGLAGATGVAAPTSWMAHEVARMYGLNRAPHVVPNGISPAPPSRAPRVLQAVTAGRLWDQAKGLGMLAGIDAPFPVYVAGECPPNPEPMAATYPGQLSHQELLHLFSQSAIYLATSLYEPFGLAPLEAAQCGCAIVARDLPNFREVWGDAAFYFQSPAVLQHLLNSLASNPRRLRAAQCRARQRAAHYTAQSMTAQYLALYEQLRASATTRQEHTLAHA